MTSSKYDACLQLTWNKYDAYLLTVDIKNTYTWHQN